ncbi:MAG: ISAzo13-like element transposase-related protein [Terriglobia bacterium]
MADELTHQGHAVSQRTVHRRLSALGYSLLRERQKQRGQRSRQPG